MVEVVNKQRKRKIDLNFWRGYAEKVAETISETTGRNLTVAFVSDRKMRELNRDFRGKNRTTDVLSFPFEETDYLGDIVISVEQAARQAEENNLGFETEIKQLIMHGILHLCGYDHETDAGEMNQYELRLREQMSI